MAYTKQDIEKIHELIERVEKTDKLLEALRRGKKLEIHWGGTVGQGSIMVGYMTMPVAARDEIIVLAKRWREDATRRLDELGIEWRKQPDDIEEPAYVP